MTTKHLFITLGVFFASAGAALAANPFDITFPIPELGNCATQKECKLYCDEPAHGEACFAFAKEHGFVSKEDAQKVEKAKELAAKKGPGGCAGEKQCHAYCEAPGHMDECLDYAVHEGYMTQQDASHIREQAKRAHAADMSGPGGCKGEACRIYCQTPEHAEECLKFAEENNLMPPEELARAKKSLQALKKGGPGGCMDEKECRAYCQDPDHAEACLNFAVENGFMPKEEAERARTFAQQSHEGGPGGCKGEQCKTYCQSPEHQEECFAFAKKHGLATEDEQKRFEAGQKLGQQIKDAGGPGGCRDDQTCRAYCSLPTHTEECIAFAATKGGVSPDEAKRMLDEFRKQSGGGQMMQGEFRSSQQGKPPEGFGGGQPPVFPQGPGGCNGPEECIKYCSDPNNRDTCAKFGPAAGGMPPGGTFRQGAPGSHPQGQLPSNGQFPAGPGGCKTMDECKKYCAEHMDECRSMMPTSNGEQGQGFPPNGQPPGGMFRQGMPNTFPQGQLPPNGQFPTGPGGCRGPEECKTYCAQHPEECKNFTSPQFTPFPKPSPVNQPAIPPFSCPDAYQPMCGTDGKTYQNGCFAKLAGTDIAYDGACRQGSTANEQALSSYPAPSPFPCPQEYYPVCGADGKTYPNSCVAKTSGAAMAYPGECKSAAPSPNPYPQEPAGGAACPTFNEPMCGTDGKTYQNGCFAKLAGTGVAYPGACGSQTGTMPYSGNMLSIFGQYLKRVFYGLHF